MGPAQKQHRARPAFAPLQPPSLMATPVLQSRAMLTTCAIPSNASWVPPPKAAAVSFAAPIVHTFPASPARPAGEALSAAPASATQFLQVGDRIQYKARSNGV